MRRPETTSVNLAFLASVFLVALLFPRDGLADAAPTPPTPFYKIVSDSVIVIQPANRLDISGAVLEDITPCVSHGTDGAKYACTDKSGNMTPYSRVDFIKAETKQAHGFFALTFPSGTFQSNRLYRLTYLQMEFSKAAPTPSSLSVDTLSTVSVTYMPRQGGANSDLPWVEGTYLFQLKSSVAFLQKAPAPVGTSPACNMGPGHSECLMDALDAKSCPSHMDEAMGSIDLRSAPAKATGKTIVNLTPLRVWPRSPTLEGNGPLTNPNGLGVIYVCIDRRSLRGDFTPDPAGAAQVLAGLDSPLRQPDGTPATWTFASGSKMSPALPPTAKTDASFYANVNMAAATGASFAWGLDGKIAMLQKPLGPGYLTFISATANTGKNTTNIKGQTYTDTIDWTLPFSYLYLHQAPPFKSSAAYTILFTVGPDYETDIEFDKRNMLVALDSTWTFKNAYRPQSYLTPAKNGALVKYPDPTLSKYGYALQLHGGLEAGSALINTVQKASTGSAKITVPSYSIVRAAPQVRGLLQWVPARSLGLLTFDDTVIGRYLFDTENTVEQFTIPATSTAASSVGLRLRPINGWKAINTLLATWNPPNNANVAITATYSDGFNAPKFTRVNSVTFGIALMY